MKGIHPIIGAVLILIISISIIAIVLETGKQPTQRIKEMMLFKEGKSNLKLIKSYIERVVEEGEGSSRIATFSVTNGNYIVEPINDSVTFLMETREQIFGVGVSKVEDGINIIGEKGKIIMKLNFSSIDLIEGCKFGRGDHEILIKNSGYNSTNEKQIVLVKALR